MMAFFYNNLWISSLNLIIVSFRISEHLKLESCYFSLGKFNFLFVMIDAQEFYINCGRSFKGKLKDVFLCLNT